MYAWRDRFAERVNRPAKHLLRDDVLAEIARRGPTRHEDLAAFRGVPQKEIEPILEAVRKARALSPDAKIEASQDEKTPFVYIVFSDTKTPRRGNQQQSPFGGTGMAFNSPEDLMKNLPKMFSGGGGGDLNNSPTFKLSIREYDDSGLRVGDKVTIEIKKSDSSGGI